MGLPGAPKSRQRQSGSAKNRYQPEAPARDAYQKRPRGAAAEDAIQSPGILFVTTMSRLLPVTTEPNPSLARRASMGTPSSAVVVGSESPMFDAIKRPHRIDLGFAPQATCCRPSPGARKTATAFERIKRTNELTPMIRPRRTCLKRAQKLTMSSNRLRFGPDKAHARKTPYNWLVSRHASRALRSAVLAAKPLPSLQLVGLRTAASHSHRSCLHPRIPSAARCRAPGRWIRCTSARTSSSRAARPETAVRLRPALCAPSCAPILAGTGDSTTMRTRSSQMPRCDSAWMRAAPAQTVQRRCPELCPSLLLP